MDPKEIKALLKKRIQELKDKLNGANLVGFIYDTAGKINGLREAILIIEGNEAHG